MPRREYSDSTVGRWAERELPNRRREPCEARSGCGAIAAPSSPPAFAHRRGKCRELRAARPILPLTRPVRRAGLYAPGRAAPSTVLMTAIPARVAGVSEVFRHASARGQAGVDLCGPPSRGRCGLSDRWGAGDAVAYADSVDPACAGPGGNIYADARQEGMFGAVGVDGSPGRPR
jgi:histidinol dehydrogenase